MKKNLLSLLIVLSLVLVSLFAPAMTSSATTAQDDAITRGEFVTLVNQKYNFYVTDMNLFTDINEGNPYLYEMQAARRAGYLNGYPDGSCAPEKYITRLEASAILSRIAKLPESRTGYMFSDQDNIPAWAASGARLVCSNGLLSVSSSGGFEPQKTLTVGEAELALEKAAEIDGRLWHDKLVTTTSYDGHALTGRLCLPTGEKMVEKLVLYVNGTGVNTYENRRVSPMLRFKYFDYFSDHLSQDNVAFFSYNTRGIKLTDTDPYYSIDWDIYSTYTPQNIAKDVISFIKALKQEERLKAADIILLGWSEGAIIAPLAALEPDNGIDALLLAGYPEMNMRDILSWQMDGAQGYFALATYFDAEWKDQITREQYDADPYGIIAAEEQSPDEIFEQIDENGDGVIDVSDFANGERAQLHQDLLAAVERGDSEWIADNFMELPASWFSAHFELGVTSDILLKVDSGIPIHIFHGTHDLNCPVKGVYDAEAKLKAQGRTNLTTHVFDKANHDLNFDEWLLSGVDDPACEAIFKVIRDY